MDIKNPALGSYEAACVLGVHWTRVAKMADSGMIVSRLLKSSVNTRKIRVYSFLDCMSNGEDYHIRVSRGEIDRRPRASLDQREPMLRLLRKVPQHIDFYDAVSVYEAADIMGVWWSFVPRMAMAGKIIGRLLISHREPGKTGRQWIYSRRSCEENVHEARALAAKGIHVGRPRARL